MHGLILRRRNCLSTANDTDVCHSSDVTKQARKQVGSQNATQPSVQPAPEEGPTSSPRPPQVHLLPASPAPSRPQPRPGALPDYKPSPDYDTVMRLLEQQQQQLANAQVYRNSEGLSYRCETLVSLFLQM